MSEYIDWFCAMAGALCSWFLGGLDGLIYALATFAIIDYLTGVMAAMINGKFSSRIGFKGIVKKVFAFLLVGVAHVVDRQFLGQTAVLRDAVILFFCANDGMSILENADEAKIPIPKILKRTFKNFKDKDKQRVDKVEK